MMNKRRLNITNEERLFFALRTGETEIKELIEAGIDINTIKDRHGRTVLMLAKTAEETKLLIEAGADVNAKDYNNATALDLAVDHFLHLQEDDESKDKDKTDNLKTIELLLKAGANIENVSWSYRSMDKDNFYFLRQCDIYKDGEVNIICYGQMIYFLQKTSLKDKLSQIDDLKINKLVKNIKINNIEKRKAQIKKSRQLRKEIEKQNPMERVSGVSLADEIAKDVISGKEKRTITPEVGTEIKRRKAFEK